MKKIKLNCGLFNNIMIYFKKIYINKIDAIHFRYAKFYILKNSIDLIMKIFESREMIKIEYANITNKLILKDIKIINLENQKSDFILIEALLIKNEVNDNNYVEIIY